MKKGIAIFWFRNDLRLTDNPGLLSALEYESILPIYILDEVNPGDHHMGQASKWWLNQSLQHLNQGLDNAMSFYSGDPQLILNDLIKRFNVTAVFWNRCYEPFAIIRDKVIKSDLQSRDIHVASFNASLLWEPWTVQKIDGGLFEVFTPFYRKGCLKSQKPREPLETAKPHSLVTDDKAKNIESLQLLSGFPWYEKLQEQWVVSEQGAFDRLGAFIQHGLPTYKDKRNFPSQNGVSRLSPYLRFGQISPHQVWQMVKSSAKGRHVDHFCSELGWREFSYYLLYHHPDLPEENLKSEYDDFPWRDHDEFLQKWQTGMTGIPIVDAGMRELWQTGYMHNRLRMIVGSFLVKNLMIHWRWGEKWFWDTLLDADLANNSASWQWVAGSGADSAPYFRIFNPMLQAEKFDPECDYIRQYVPELAKLSNQFIRCPWAAPEDVLLAADVKLGLTYPVPIVDLEQSRELAQRAFDEWKSRH